MVRDRHLFTSESVRDRHLFTSESVTEGHPDKIADQISDAVLDAALTNDAMSRAARPTLITTGPVLPAGAREAGGVVVAIDEQSPDIAQGVDKAYELTHDPGDDDPLDSVGAGDQGM